MTLQISPAMRQRYAPHINAKIGALTFLGLSDQRADNNRLLGIFRCSCGNVSVLPAGRVLRNKKRTHCGCQTDRGSHRTHGMRNSPEYSSWTAMKGRCLDPNNKDFPRWGGIGVTVHQPWVESFEEFYAHIGARPEGTTLDRIDNAEGYVPNNVRWATPREQASNRKDTWIVVIAGVEFPSKEAAARAHSVSTTTIRRWCMGFHDSRRRSNANEGFTPAKPGCRMWRKYAA